MKTKHCFLIMVTVILFPVYAFAVTLNVVDGQLMGAKGINVNGAFYDVQFVDGTCLAVFDGCDQSSDFVFPSMPSAQAAAQALLDQVLLDGSSGMFDSDPALTNGMEILRLDIIGEIYTPYELSAFFHVESASTLNSVNEFQDGVYIGASVGRDFDTGPLTNTVTWAKWNVSAIPLPPSVLLFGSGMVLLGFMKRKLKG